jgi:hypothetical protein
MRRSVLVLPLLLVGLAGNGWSAAARSRPVAPAGPQLTVEPQAAAPGETVVLSGRGFPRNAAIQLLAGPPRSEGRRIGSARTGRRGTFTATIRIRAQADPGPLVALACHDACVVKAVARFRIVAP